MIWLFNLFAGDSLIPIFVPFIFLMMYTVQHKTAKISTEDYIREFRDKEKFILFCRECNRYGNCWSCPPYAFDTDAFLSSFHFIYIIATVVIPDETDRLRCTDQTKAMEYGTKIIKEVREKIAPGLLALENKYPASRAFFAGSCYYCPEGGCMRMKDLPCKYPHRIRFSLESFGFDIGLTARKLLHTELKWSKDGLLPEYFTLVSALFSATETNEKEWME